MRRTKLRATVGATVLVALGLVAGGCTGSSTPRADEAAGGRQADAQHAEGPEDKALEEGGEEEEDGGPSGPADYLTLKFTSGQEVTAQQVRRGIAQARAVPRAGGEWSLVGPSNIGGRIVDLAVDPSSEDTVYVAASGGGVWRSNDAGSTFQPAWPAETTQTLGALAMASDGTLWAGTGEANPSGGGLTYFGDGVYRSTDKGEHWQQWGLRDSAAIGKIAVDPVDPDTVFVAASGSLSRSVSQRGIYRVTNGGKDWKQVLAPPNDTTGGIDIAIDPSNHDRVFAALWDHKRNNGARVYGGTGSGLYRSDDGGDTWKRLENVQGTASTDTAGTGLKSDQTLGRIGVALAPGNPDRVYVITGTQYGPDKGFYVSDDGGDSFRPGGRAGGNSGFDWWFGRLWVDPKDQDHLFNADINLRESKDGGRTWTVSSGVHADQHAMQWDPSQPSRVYLGNDGGVWRSDRDGASGSWQHATYEPWNQSYHLAVAADDPTRLATGLQDNGSQRTWTPSSSPDDLTRWNAYGGGDGHYVVIDYRDHNTYYECSQVGNCTRHEDVNGTDKRTRFGQRHSSRITTDAPVVLDPTSPDVVYFGGNVLDRSTDRGSTFTQISPPGDYLTGPVPPEEDDKGPYYSGLYATITAIAPAKTAPNTIFVGTDTGRLWKTDNLGEGWTEMQGLPDRWVNAIVVDPTDADHVYAAFSGYREGDGSANVWETTDGGRSWSNISGNMPNAPVEMITYDAPHKQLYAATDLGVFYRASGAKNWKTVGSGLPSTPVLDIKITGDGRTLYAATFGRSIWKIPTLG